MKFLEIFNKIEKGNYALTDEAIYSSIKNNDEMIPLYGGNQSHKFTDRRVSVTAKTKKGEKIKIFDREGIIISLDGSAGSMTYKKGEKFALNHHAGFITIKDNCEKKASLEFFALFFQNFYRSLGISDGSKTLSLEQIYSEELELPSYDIQISIISKLKPIINKINILYHLKEKYCNLFEKTVIFDYNKYQSKNVDIKECITYLSGTSELTEEKNYLRLNNDGEQFHLLTGAISSNNSQIVTISENDAVPKFESKEGLLVSRKGKAGYTKYLTPGRYTLNDDAYILLKKENCEYEINLKWLAIQYKHEIISYASNSDNGTWNMTGFFNNTKIDIPDILEQDRVVELNENLIKIIEKVNNIEEIVMELLKKEIT